MIQKIHKFGNSLAVVIPVSENRAHRIAAGEVVEVVETQQGWQVRDKFRGRVEKLISEQPGAPFGVL